MKPRVFKESGHWQAECCGGRWFTTRQRASWKYTLTVALNHFETCHRQDSEVPS